MTIELLPDLEMILQTVNQILTAGIAITGFSLLLYAITLNLRQRVIRSFALILIVVTIIFTAEALGSVSASTGEMMFWIRLQWVGIIYLPPTYLHFSDAVLSTTGQPSRGKRHWAVRICYLISFGLLIALFTTDFLGPLVMNEPPAPHVQMTPYTDLVAGYYLGLMILSWYNFVRAYRRAVTHTSRRRMGYLLAGGLSPALGSFPFLIFSSSFSASFPLLFWSIAILVNLACSVLLVVMAYSVAFFGVPWPDRIIKSRLFKWIMRGPVTASLTLALATIVRRVGELFGNPYTAFVPIIMVGTILLCEFVITMAGPYAEKMLFHGQDKKELEAFQTVGERLVTKNDLQQFLEMVLASVCDLLQAPAAFVMEVDNHSTSIVVRMGRPHVSPVEFDALENEQKQNLVKGEAIWTGGALYMPLRSGNGNGEEQFLGVMGIETQKDMDTISDEEWEGLHFLTNRAVMSLRDKKLQEQVLLAIETLNPQVEYLQRLRAAGRYDRAAILKNMDSAEWSEMTLWVRDALTHYWGGPKLTENPLMKLNIVQSQISLEDDNSLNALRSILRKAIDMMKPEGERKFTGEWMLYNILQMKFFEGKKVKEIAIRLSMSEADLYRKQKVAIDEVAHLILKLESSQSNTDVLLQD